MPKPIASTTPVDEKLLAASRESKIAPPMRRVASAASAPAGGSSLESLIAACRDTKIAPPMLKPRTAVTSVPPKQVARSEPPQPPPAPIAAAAPVVTATPAPKVEDTPAAVAIVPAVPAPKVEETPAIVADSTAAPVPQPVPTQEPESTPVRMPKAPAPLSDTLVDAQGTSKPKTAPTAEPVPGPASTAPPAPDGDPTKPMELPDLLSSDSKEDSSAPDRTPVAAAPPDVAVDPSLAAASRESGIELPQPATHSPVPATPAPTAGAVDPSLAAASSESGIELPKPTPAAIAVDPSLAAARRESGIELPQRPGATDEPTVPNTLSAAAVDEVLQAAAEESNLPLPVPIAVQQADALAEACKDAKIPPPATIKP